ncbi:1,4-dihydroxy-2-naphthoate polyprenyltransferase [Lentilactobacillus kisonensis]|uniref:1,4-dihydroxy-2-naphthoate octaprenyltransferase family protein n=2 Tax=Lentilactobacillus kisonensis TaxID=481722 RepID=A0A0R1NPR0_9LACO|nr:1,4-dihydroxy-2-naphthoate polyprenyltransferase [Lentilactobacillus kisonensis]KRL22382.1 1,4-dihydroxy-2-naphthoate octaprenyltransferase family protein [Lentilactobacillus kisonensis DSM 19906 = JCM 15041]
MNLSTFTELIEFKILGASAFPFSVGLFFSWYFLNSVNGLYAALFFIAMILFDAAVNVMDNYNDFHHSDAEEYKSKTNIVGRANISATFLNSLLVALIGPSAAIGLYLTTKVGLPLLWMGMFCFAIGVLYSTGPHPISSTPFGELVSGFTMGVMIVLISVYINSYQVFTWNPELLLEILLAAAPEFIWIGNIMFSNNICDAEEDRLNHRYTIVHYLGVPHSVFLFNAMNILAILLIFLAIFLGVYPAALISIALAVPFIFKQMRLFTAEQVKTKTFVCSVRILGAGSLSLWVGFLAYWLYSLVG